MATAYFSFFEVGGGKGTVIMSRHARGFLSAIALFAALTTVAQATTVVNCPGRTNTRGYPTYGPVSFNLDTTNRTIESLQGTPLSCPGEDGRVGVGFANGYWHLKGFDEKLIVIDVDIPGTKVAYRCAHPREQGDVLTLTLDRHAGTLSYVFIYNDGPAPFKDVVACTVVRGQAF